MFGVFAENKDHKIKRLKHKLEKAESILHSTTKLEFGDFEIIISFRRFDYYSKSTHGIYKGEVLKNKNVLIELTRETRGQVLQECLGWIEKTKNKQLKLINVYSFDKNRNNQKYLVNPKDFRQIKNDYNNPDLDTVNFYDYKTESELQLSKNRLSAICYVD